MLKFNQFINEMTTYTNHKLEDHLNSKLIYSKKWKKWYDWDKERDAFYSTGTDQVDIDFNYILDEDKFVKEIKKLVTDFNKQHDSSFVLIGGVLKNKSI